MDLRSATKQPARLDSSKERPASAAVVVATEFRTKCLGVRQCSAAFVARGSIRVSLRDRKLPLQKLYGSRDGDRYRRKGAPHQSGSGQVWDLRRDWRRAGSSAEIFSYRRRSG